MTRRFESDYRMKDGTTRLSEAYFNPIFSDVDLRLHAQETVEKDWRAAVAELNEFGLERINETLGPLIEQFQQIATFGFMTATLQANDAIIFDLGDKTVQVNEGAERQYFVTAPYLALVAGNDPDLYAIARCLTYDRVTGALELDIVARSAGLDADPGPHASVIVSVLPGGYQALHMLVEAAQDHRLAAELAAATAATHAAAATAAITVVDEIRTDVETARDQILAVVPGGGIPITREMVFTGTLGFPYDFLAGPGGFPVVKSYTLVLICESDDVGYSEGDRIPEGQFFVEISGDKRPAYNINFNRTATSAGFVVAQIKLTAGGLVRGYNNATGSPVSLDHSKWSIELRIFG